MRCFYLKEERINGAMIRFPILALLILSLVFACSTPSWFPIKKGPPHKAKMKELLNKEVIILEGEEYVKVVNPAFSSNLSQPKYLYIPVDRYLSEGSSYAASAPKEETKKDLPVPVKKPSPPMSDKEVRSILPPTPKRTDLKKKVVIAHFDDRTTGADELIGDWISERVANEVNRRSSRILLVDYRMVEGFLQKKGFQPADMENPNVLHLLNEGFGIQAVVLGELTGPYVFRTETGGDQGATSSAVVKVGVRILETSGKSSSLSGQNPVVATKETGPFSEEKAKMKAIDLAIVDLTRSLLKELDVLEWFCRISKVDGNEFYINAGRLSGLKVGDVMDVLQDGIRGEAKGKIRISGWFGTDASIGTLLQGSKADVNDILKPTGSEGT